jgi:metal-responsive CopG/Arc/MetJ family transcriptional regulator
MSTVKLNITLPEDIADELDRLTKKREKSRFISEAISARIGEIKQKKLEQELEEGYKETAQEATGLLEEFEVTDLEGWDDY